jgi:hypothetical protein
MDAARTGRFLDPPVLENFTNHATLAGVKGSFERDLTQKDRLRLSLRFDRAAFLVPNELIQQENPHREDRSNREVSGQARYQHKFSSNVLGTVQGRVRDDEAGLTAHASSWPMQPMQDRGFREGYVSATVAADFNHHEIQRFLGHRDRGSPHLGSPPRLRLLAVRVGRTLREVSLSAFEDKSALLKYSFQTGRNA